MGEEPKLGSLWSWKKGSIVWIYVGNGAYCRVQPAEGDQILREDLANHPNFMEVDNA